LRRVTPLQLTFFSFLFSLVFFGSLTLSDGLNWVEQLNMSIILGVLFLGVLSSAVAFFGIHYALASLSATQVTVAANLIPVIALFAEVFLIGMDITLLKVVGVAVTITGVLLTQLAGRSSGQLNVTKEV
jgi:drug/metabolite transporter (DMT)-like permease